MPARGGPSPAPALDAEAFAGAGAEEKVTDLLRRRLGIAPECLIMAADVVRDFPGTRLLGTNCPGIISPGKCNIGITAGEIAPPPSAALSSSVPSIETAVRSPAMG